MYGYLVTLSDTDPEGRVIHPDGSVTWRPGRLAAIFVEDGEWYFMLQIIDEENGFYRETGPVGPFRTAEAAEAAARRPGRFMFAD
jgi:hypothetical protein